MTEQETIKYETIKYETITERYLVDKKIYGNIRLHIRHEIGDYVVVFVKSCYSYNSFNGERTFCPAEYRLLKKVKEDEYQTIEVYECPKRNTTIPHQLSIKMKDILCAYTKAAEIINFKDGEQIK